MLNRKTRRMLDRGVLHVDVLGTIYVVSKHNTARALRFAARNKKD